MTIHDYVIDPHGLDWPELLVHWHWLLPERYTVRMMNRFGDLFLEYEDGSIHMFDLGRGSVCRVAEDRDTFADRLDEVENAEGWLLSSLVDQLVDAGVTCPPGHCYSFRCPPVLGGQYAPENTCALPISQHYAYFAAIYHQIQDVPPARKKSRQRGAPVAGAKRRKK